ncbi:MAG: DNA-binding response regulator, partial [Verrucomicrobiales bacterium]|nr:DNA-binding response regulator [Verrucomicrobiales bacterium]
SRKTFQPGPIARGHSSGQLTRFCDRDVRHPNVKYTWTMSLSHLPSNEVNSPAAKNPIRVLLADDHEIIRLGTATFLKTLIGCDICAETADGREALKLAEQTHPDVAVIDLGLPGLNGLEVTRQMRRQLPNTEVVVLTGDGSAEMTQRAYESGAKAFILKVDASAHLAEAVQTVAEHRFYVTPQAHATLHLKKPAKPVATTSARAKRLTSRERDVIQLLAEGESNKEVGGSLGISVKTVETHRAAIMKKLKLARFSDLVRYAILHKIIHA